MVNLCKTLLLNDNAHAIPAEVYKIIKPTPVIDKIKEVDVAPIITNVSSDSNFVFRVLEFFLF